MGCPGTTDPADINLRKRAGDGHGPVAGVSVPLLLVVRVTSSAARAVSQPVFSAICVPTCTSPNGDKACASSKRSTSRPQNSRRRPRPGACPPLSFTQPRDTQLCSCVGASSVTASTSALVNCGSCNSGWLYAGANGISREAITRSKRVRTTIPAADGCRAGDLLDRDFSAQAPNTKWITDFTYVRTWSPSWAYVSFIVDCFSQRIIAWHAQSTMHTDLVMTPLKIAL